MSAPRGLTTVAGEQTPRPMQKRPGDTSTLGPFRQPGRSRDRSAMSMNLMDYALTGKPKAANNLAKASAARPLA